MAKFSVGIHPTAATETTVLTVPSKHIAIVSLVYLTNHSGNNKTCDLYWEHAHDTAHDIYLVDGRVFTTTEILSLDQIEIVLQENDKIKIITEAGSDFSVIVTFDLQLAPATTFNFND
jgi:hypothetical protein